MEYPLNLRGASSPTLAMMTPACGWQGAPYRIAQKWFNVHFVPLFFFFFLWVREAALPPTARLAGEGKWSPGPCNRRVCEVAPQHLAPPVL